MGFLGEAFSNHSLAQGFLWVLRLSGFGALGFRGYWEFPKMGDPAIVA